VSYSVLISFAKWQVLIVVFGFAVTIAWQLLTGRINTRYLLWGRRSDGSRYFSPERVQLLIATIAVAFQYFYTASQSSTGTMPDLPSGTLELLGLSNVVYLGGKAFTTFTKPPTA
jgi:hypothetical protein